MSGSFFMFSSDKKFIIKTIRGSEKKILLGILDDFINYLKRNNNVSLLAKVFGLFTIRTKQFVPVDFIVLENVAQYTDSNHARMTFDLKGSTLGRKTKLKDDQVNFWRRDLHFKRTLKDLDWLAINKDLGDKLMKL